MCKQIVKDGWEGGEGLSIQQKVKVCSEKLWIWGREVTGNFSNRIKQCRKEMRYYKGKRDVVSQEKYNEAKKSMTLVLNPREIFWLQRAKQLWLQAGDQNSRYFHASMSLRKRNNQIHRLQNDEGQWVEWDNGLEELITEYFSGLFSNIESHW